MRSVTRLSTYPYHPGAGRKKQTRKAHPKQSPSKTGAFFWPPSRQAYFRPLSNNTERAIHISLWNSSFCHIHTRKKKYRIGPVISKSKKHSLNPIPSTIIIVVIHFHPICSEYISPAHTHIASHHIHLFVRLSRRLAVGSVGYAYTMISSHPLLSNGILQAYI